MDNAVAWFCYLCVNGGTLTASACRQLTDVLSDDADLYVFAQAVLDHGLTDDVDAVQAAMDEAHTNAQAGLEPPTDLFADDDDDDDDAPAAYSDTSSTARIDVSRQALMESHEWSDLPVLDGVEDLPEEEVVELMTQLLKVARGIGASDLHLSAGARPFLRLNLEIRPFGQERLSAEASLRLNTCLLDDEQREIFERDGDLDLALSLDDDSRFRVNLLIHKEGAAGTYRLVPNCIISLEDLGFRDARTIKKLLDHHNGLILVTGPIGSGKTTTLAALVDVINSKRQDHIITVEDPIEIVHTSKSCNVTQREVGSHTKNFAAALKGALREDPDVIVIGELRDLETIEMAITAAETGHLVIGTLHTSDSASTLDRLLDVFPPEQQQQIRAMTAESLRGIICQRLIPATNGGLAIAAEILIHTIAVANIIRDGKTHQLAAVLQTGAQQGMKVMDASIYELFEEGAISKENALALIRDKQYVNRVKNPAPLSTGGTTPQQQASPRDKKKGWFR